MTAGTTSPTIEEFVEELRSEIEAAGLLPMQAPFVKKLMAGELTRDQIRTWAEQFYFGTLNAPKWLANDFVNCPDPELAREFAENIYEEMTGKLSHSKKHTELFKDFLRALGLSDDDIANLKVIEEFRPVFDLEVPKRYEPEEWWIKICLDGLLFEGSFGDVSEVMYEVLKEKYGFTHDEVNFFEIHAEADKDHGETLMKAFQHVATTEEGREKIRARALRTAQVARLVYEHY